VRLADDHCQVVETLVGVEAHVSGRVGCHSFTTPVGRRSGTGAVSTPSVAPNSSYDNQCDGAIAILVRLGV
jgi:hypothetical protein